MFLVRFSYHLSKFKNFILQWTFYSLNIQCSTAGVGLGCSRNQRTGKNVPVGFAVYRHYETRGSSVTGLQCTGTKIQKDPL
jgi:hypothetical protein